MQTAELQKLAAEVGVPVEDLKRDQTIDALAAWASKACMSHLEAQLRGEPAAAPASGDAAPSPDR